MGYKWTDVLKEFFLRRSRLE